MLQTLRRASLLATRSLGTSSLSSRTATASIAHRRKGLGESEPLPWQISASLLVERPALVTRPLTDLERRMEETFMEMENEASLKSDHELRQEVDEAREDRKRRGVPDPEDLLSLRTAQDDEDDWQKELEAFSPAPVVTEADEKSDRTSVKRALHRPLRLIVRQRYGDDFLWDLPTTRVRDPEGGEETLRQAAERALAECCGTDLSVAVLGNAPFGFYKETFSSKIRDMTGCNGQKVFIYKAFLTSGNVKLQDEKASQFEWLLREELATRLNSVTWRAVDKMLLDELL